MLGNPSEKIKKLIQTVARTYRALLEPGQVVELRAIGVRRDKYAPHIEGGFYDTKHIPDMVQAALALTSIAEGVYWTLNPLHPDLLARRFNRADWVKCDESATDKDVLRRRWLLIDADPVRRPKISSTEAEKAHARTTVQYVRDHLRGKGWPDPYLADSGNGYHLLYRIDLPAEDEDTVKQILRALADRFDTKEVKIDRSVFNASRICKFYGTIARKGDSTSSRPHRFARLLGVLKE